jgi:hypothetical protein
MTKDNIKEAMTAIKNIERMQELQYIVDRYLHLQQQKQLEILGEDFRGSTYRPRFEESITDDKYTKEELEEGFSEFKVFKTNHTITHGKISTENPYHNKLNDLDKMIQTQQSLLVSNAFGATDMTTPLTELYDEAKAKILDQKPSENESKRMDTDVKSGASLGGISTSFMTEANKTLAEMARNIEELQKRIEIESTNPSRNEDILPEDPSSAKTKILPPSKAADKTMGLNR